MAPNPMPQADVDLRVLDAYLMSDDAPEECMMIPDLDGFLTGIAVGPEPIPQSEWMSRIWGGEDPKFTGTEEAEMVFGTIIGRYNEIVAQLEAGPDSFEPMFEQSADGRLIVTDWAAGFIDAAMLRPERWEALIRDDGMAAVFWPLLLLGADDDNNPPFGAPPVPAESMDELYENAYEIITESIFRIRAFWQQHATDPVRKEKPGRRPTDTRRRR